MKINKIEITNFYSCRNVKINFNQYKGIVLIEGVNKDTDGGSNGSGKSVLIEAIVWALFGRTVRKSTEEALVNNTAKKGCKVRITINDDIVIERGKRPVFLKVFKNKKEITRDNALNTQALIEEILNTNYKVFLASTIFGQQNNIEFISATPEDKRAIIKNFLNLDNLFSLRDSVKALKSQYSQGIKRNDSIIGEYQKSVKAFDDKLKDLEALSKSIENSKYANALDFTLEDILRLEKYNSELAWSRSTSEKSACRLRKEITALEESFSKQKDSTNCITCGQPVERRIHPKHLSEQKSSLLHELEKISLELQKLNNMMLKEVPISSMEYSKVIEYQGLKKEEATYTDLKKETLQKIQIAYNEKQEFVTNYDIMRFWEKAFSEAGLVKYIIRSVLDYFNRKVNFYLAHLSQGAFRIEFNEELKETITHRKKDIYFMSLSGGEKKKISLSVMLGLQDLLCISNTEKNNIMFFDECAESLDFSGLDGLYILLSELKKNKTLFVITHNNYLKSLLDNSQTLTMIKSRGASKLIGK